MFDELCHFLYRCYIFTYEEEIARDIYLSIMIHDLNATVGLLMLSVD